jgi:hypothetical protein
LSFVAASDAEGVFMSRRVLGFLVALVLGVTARAANATPITYTESGVATGSLDGVAFRDALVTITLTGDTTGATGGPGFFTNAGPATVNVAGFSPATLLGSIIVFDNTSTPGAGIEDLTAGGDILDTLLDPAFATYGLTTSLGPITGPAAFNPGKVFSTTSGNFIITAVTTSTFTAVTAAPTPVPEPTSLLLLGTGVVGAALRRRKRA